MAVQEKVASHTTPGVGAHAQRRTTQFPWVPVFRWVAVILVIALSIIPLYWTFITSIKSGLELNYSPPTLIPESFSLENYVTDFTQTPAFTRGLLNSAIIAGITTILALVFGSMGAYALARTKFRGKGLVLGIVLSVQIFPFIVLVGPLFVAFTGAVYIYNTYAALIIPDLVAVLPVTVWFLNSFFRTLPGDLEEAARIDGATHIQALWYVIAPLAAPGVFATAILSFIAIWNDFLFGLTLASDSNAQPVTVAIANFNGEHTIPWGEIAAASVIVVIPLVIMVLFLQRRIVSGLTAGAVKG